MGFWQTLFPDRPEASRAPIFENQSPAPIVGTGTPVTQPPPVPAQAPQVQPAPGSTQTQSAPGDQQNRWTGIMNRISQPDVLGPLQTFLAAASAPLQPGESMGGRLAYASTLMQLHKSMLNENARLAPYQQQERELKLQQAQSEIDRNTAAVNASNAQTRRTNQEIDLANETKLQKIDLLDQQIRAAQAQGNAAEAQRLEAEKRRLLEEKWGDKKTQADLDYKAALTAQARHAANAPYSTAKGAVKNPLYAKLTDEGFRKTFENSVRKPYFDWSATQKAQGAAYDWASYLAQSKNVAQINEMIDEASARGMPMEWLTAGGSAPRQGAAPQGALGTPQNPITRPRPGGQPVQQPSAFPPGLPDRIPR